MTMTRSQVLEIKKRIDALGLLAAPYVTGNLGWETFFDRRVETLVGEMTRDRQFEQWSMERLRKHAADQARDEWLKTRQREATVITEAQNSIKQELDTVLQCARDLVLPDVIAAELTDAEKNRLVTSDKFRFARCERSDARWNYSCDRRK